MTKPLSPSAQAVDRAIADRIQLLGEIAPSRQVAAAALVAAADQVVPEQLEGPTGSGFRWGAWATKNGVRSELLTIAAELEGAQ